MGVVWNSASRLCSNSAQRNVQSLITLSFLLRFPRSFLHLLEERVPRSKLYKLYIYCENWLGSAGLKNINPQALNIIQSCYYDAEHNVQSLITSSFAVRFSRCLPSLWVESVLRSTVYKVCICCENWLGSAGLNNINSQPLDMRSYSAKENNVQTSITFVIFSPISTLLSSYLGEGGRVQRYITCTSAPKAVLAAHG